MAQNSNFAFIRVSSIIISLIVIIESIVQIVVTSKDLNADKANNTIFIVLLSVKIFLSTVSIAVVYKILAINYLVSSLFTSFYAISMAFILFYSTSIIDFRHKTLNLIIQLIATYVAFTVFLNWLIITNNEELELSEPLGENENNNENYKELRNQFLDRKNSWPSKVITVIDKNLLAIATVLTVVLAIVLGIVIKHFYPQSWSQRSLKLIGFVGEIFLRVLKCLILPLIFTSIVFAMANIDIKLSGKIGARICVYYLTTTVLAMILGVVMVLIIKPGSKATKYDDMLEHSGSKIVSEDSVLDLIRNLFPDNLIEACFKSYQTVLIPPVNGSENTTDLRDWTIQAGSANATNILGMVSFAIAFGLVIGRLPNRDERQVLIHFFESCSNSILTITAIVIKFSPIGVLFLVFSVILSVEGISEMIEKVGWYTLTTTVCICIHGFFTLPLLYLVLTKRNPFKFKAKVFDSLLTAFGTASSSATVPVTIHCLEERASIDKRIVRFTVPLGATINMDGAAIYEAVAAIFIAQYRDWDLTVAQVLIISVTATAVSVGAAGIPQAGPIFLVIILNSIGLPPEDAALIYLADWILDRLATTLNVMGDSYAAAVVHHLSKADLAL